LANLEDPENCQAACLGRYQSVTSPEDCSIQFCLNIHKRCSNIRASFVNDFPGYDKGTAIEKHTAKRETPVMRALRYFLVIFIGIMLSGALAAFTTRSMRKLRYRPKTDELAQVPHDRIDDDNYSDSDSDSDSNNSNDDTADEASSDRGTDSEPIQLRSLDRLLNDQRD
jgi:hypothetical protein